MIHEAPVRFLAFTPDSKSIFSGDDNGVLIQSTAPDGKQAGARRCHESSISALDAGPEGMIVTGGIDKCVRVWTVDTHAKSFALLREIRLADEITGLAFRPRTPDTLAITVITGEILLWKALSEASPQRFQFLRSQANSAAWSPDGRRLAVGSDDWSVYQYDFSGGRELVLAGHQHHADQVSYSRCGRYLASGSHDRSVRVWCAETGRCLAVLPHRLDTAKADWSEDGRLVTCSYDQHIRIWNPLQQELLAKIHAHDHDADDVAWSPDGRWIASSGWDRAVKIFNSDRYEHVSTIEGGNEQISALTYSGSRLFAGTSGGQLHTIDSDRLRCLAPTVSRHRGPVTSAAVSPNGGILATTGADSRLCLEWQNQQHPLITLESEHGLDLEIIRFSPDGRRIAVGARDNSLTVYRLIDRQLQTIYSFPHERRLKAVAWANSGGLLATAADGDVRLFDVTGRVIRQWRAHQRMINAIAWSSDDDHLVTACWDHHVRVFRRDGTLIHDLVGHSYNVNDVDVSGDGIIATAGWDGVVSLWDLTTGFLCKALTIPGPTPVQTVRWLRGTATLVAGTWAGEILVIDGQTLQVEGAWKRSRADETNLVPAGDAR